MAPSGQTNIGETYVKPWCNECKSHHTGNYSRHTRVWCYQYSEIGHYARDYPKRIL